MQTQNNKSTLRADYYKVSELSLYFPKEEKNEFLPLKDFYLELIKLIPNEITLKLLTNVEAENRLSIKRKNIQEIKCAVNDIWLKDFMGFNVKRKIVKPLGTSNACNCKVNIEEEKKFNTIIEELITNEYQKELKQLPLVMDGGNMVTNGKIGFISNKILLDNPKKSKEEILGIISDELGITPILVENNKYDKVGQISAYMQFINKNTIAISQYPDLKELSYDNEYLEHLVKEATDLGLEVIRLREIPCYENTKCTFGEDKKNCTLGSNGTFINFLIINGLAIIPEYSDLEDIWECNQYNKELLSIYFDNVVSINCDKLAEVGGLLNSITFVE